jgi:phospholipid/cholesterol/gamma-HCH transport system ATP-binding protein
VNQATAPAAAPRALVSVQGLTMAFGSKLVQRDLNFEVLQGEVLAVCGGSGCGKSTLLRHMVGLQEPAKGSVLHGSRDLYASDPAAVADLRRSFGVMFQAGALWSSMTVGENVMLPMEMFTPLRAAERADKARAKLALVGLEASFDAEPSALSGGMKKRAAIARALALDPALLFLDEPSAGLDPLSSADLDALILQLQREMGTTVVMVSHELDSIFSVASRVLFLDAASKTMTALGPPRELQRSGPPGVRAFFRQRGLQELAA